ncbi:hypothetical protein QM467_12995 [Rhodoblastus sp. 17X3]|uniref:hypothetical protein n=1 Tax=Rhodoblastus sp. 17X3 TaxID=3047026 RepID=UPI0024B75337|nr:hypothetical protein [Rhodoblastus sp. 17X3]MDI9848973.1 hypothetical protein [Rhodoblastus sp. 17X3]
MLKKKFAIASYLSWSDFMPSDKTHREVKKPQITIRYLAEYMNASDRTRRTILRGCKYQPIARVVQHDEAKGVVSRFVRDYENNDFLLSEADRIRNKLADSDFERDVNDHNADYITRFATISDRLHIPEADRLAPGRAIVASLGGTKLNIVLQFKLRRLTKTNKIRVGGGMLRYAKGKPLPAAVGEWQSAILFGVLGLPGTITDEAAEAEQRLCLTIDAQSGHIYPAPTNSVSRFKNSEAACATIADAWDQIEPPSGAVI